MSTRDDLEVTLRKGKTVILEKLIFQRQIEELSTKEKGASKKTVLVGCDIHCSSEKNVSFRETGEF